MIESVLLATPRFPPDTGGVEQYVLNLGRELVRRAGLRVVIVATAPSVGRSGGNARLVDRDSVAGLSIYRLARDYTISNTPVGVGWARQLRGIIRAERVDLVNAHAPVPVLADLAARACGRIPFVLSYHNASMRKGRWLPDLAIGAYERFVLPRTARRADRVVCSSDFVARHFAAEFGDKAVTIPPGADLDLFTPAPLPTGEPRILFVASLHRSTSYKGLSDLLMAVADLRRRGRPVHLDVAGDGDDQARYADEARTLGVAEAVRFRGRLADTDLVRAYHEATLVALPTYYDSFPTVLVEAMACARPVVSTPVGGIPTLIEDGVTGLLGRPGDVPGLVDRLDRVLTDRELAERLAWAGREKVAEELSWEHQAARTIEVYAAAQRVRRQAAPSGTFAARAGSYGDPAP